MCADVLLAGDEDEQRQTDGMSYKDREATSLGEGKLWIQTS